MVYCTPSVGLPRAALGPDAIQAILQRYPTPLHLHRAYKVRVGVGGLGQARGGVDTSLCGSTTVDGSAGPAHHGRPPIAPAPTIAASPVHVQDAAARATEAGQDGHRAAERLLQGLKTDRCAGEHPCLQAVGAASASAHCAVLLKSPLPSHPCSGTKSIGPDKAAKIYTMLFKPRRTSGRALA